jgi:hypothetical protein
MDLNNFHNAPANEGDKKILFRGFEIIPGDANFFLTPLPIPINLSQEIKVKEFPKHLTFRLITGTP